MDNYELQGQEEFYDNLNQSEKIGEVNAKPFPRQAFLCREGDQDFISDSPSRKDAEKSCELYNAVIIREITITGGKGFELKYK